MHFSINATIEVKTGKSEYDARREFARMLTRAAMQLEDQNKNTAPLEFKGCIVGRFHFVFDETEDDEED